jgi:hypothetical protein
LEILANGPAANEAMMRAHVNKLTVLIVGLLLFSSVSASFAEVQSEEIRLNGRIVLNAFRGLVEDHLEGVRGGLKALAAIEDARSGDWERIKAPLGQFSQSIPTDAAMWFAKSDGSYFTVQAGGAAKTLKDRDYFPTLLAGQDVEGSLVISKSTGARSVIVAAPILSGGKVIGALGASISSENLSNLVHDNLGLPSDVIFYALNAQGQTALHGMQNLIFEFPSDMGDESLKSAVKKILTETEGSESYTFRGSPRTVLFEKSRIPGWAFVLGVAGR